MIFGKKKPVISLIKELISCPDEFRFEGEVVDGEIVIRFKKKPEVIEGPTLKPQIATEQTEEGPKMIEFFDASKYIQC